MTRKRNRELKKKKNKADPYGKPNARPQLRKDQLKEKQGNELKEGGTEPRKEQKKS